MDKNILIRYLDSLKDIGIVGCDCIICRDHEQIFRHTTGYADSGMTKPLTDKNLFWLFSASKLITCTAALQLVEKGKIHLDDKVSKYLPEYENMKVRKGAATVDAKNSMTVRHLFTMQSGLNYDLDAPEIRKVLKNTGGTATTRQVIAALAGEPLDFEPGTHFQYSLSHDVLGAVIEAVSGQKLGEYIGEHILKPLGMTNTGFKLTQEKKKNMADLFEYDGDKKISRPVVKKNDYVFSENYESGGAGLISNAGDYIKFLDAMCNGGLSRDGHRLLSADTIDMMRHDELSETSKKDFQLLVKPGYSYGLGARTLIEKEKSGSRSPIGEFGWDGAAGAYALIDEKDRLAVFYIQHILNCDHAFKVMHPHIRNLVYEMLNI